MLLRSISSKIAVMAGNRRFVGIVIYRIWRTAHCLLFIYSAFIGVAGVSLLVLGG
jgi:hypothetical protein